jgi:DNA glycosylase AlkZ-like
VAPSSNGIFLSTIIINGRVAGTWKRSLQKKNVRIDLDPFRTLTKAEMRGIRVASERYGEFLGVAVEISER